MREAGLSATCYVALIILEMAFINVEWELPNGTTAVSWTGMEEGELLSSYALTFLLLNLHTNCMSFIVIGNDNSIYQLLNLHRAVLRSFHVNLSLIHSVIWPDVSVMAMPTTVIPV